MALLYIFWGVAINEIPVVFYSIPFAGRPVLDSAGAEPALLPEDKRNKARLFMLETGGTAETLDRACNSS